MAGFEAAFSEFLPFLRTGEYTPLHSVAIDRSLFDQLLGHIIFCQSSGAYKVKAQIVEHWLSALRFASLNESGSLAEITPAEIATFCDDLPEGSLSKHCALLTTLKLFAQSVVEMGGHDKLPRQSEVHLRSAWSDIPGLSRRLIEELLILCGQPVYLVDRGSYRILVRHGWIDSNSDQTEVQEMIVQAALEDRANLDTISNSFAYISKHYCKVTQANCAECPLARWLPANGIPYGLEE